MLLVFTSSLWGEGVLAAHNIYQLSAKSGDQVVSSSACLDGFAISGGMNVSIATDATPRLFQRMDLEDDQEQEERKMIVSNCSTSLQILPAATPALTVRQTSSLISSSILLLSPQLFTNQLADPPRIG